MSSSGEAMARMSPDEFLRLLDRGLIREVVAGKFVLSRAGAAKLRAALNRHAGTAAVRARGVSGTRREPRSPERVVVNDAESPLAWLRTRRDKSGQALLSQLHFEAGERLRRDYTIGQLMPRVTSSWDPASPGRRRGGGAEAGLEIGERALAARQRVAAALTAAGPELAGVLVDVCCFLRGLEDVEASRGWPRRSGKVALQLGLAHLARHYGLDGRQSGSGGRGIQHWGADDYRPVMDGPGDGRDSDGEA